MGNEVGAHISKEIAETSNTFKTIFTATTNEIAAKDIDMRNPSEVKDRNGWAHHKADMELIRSSKKQVSADEVLKI